MALTIEGGISIGGNITISPSNNIDPTANLILFYDAGNSMSYNGSGSTFNTSFTGPNVEGYQQYGIIDLAGVIGNVWHSGQYSGGGSITWTSQGVASYWSLIGTDNQYIAGDWQQGPTLNSPTYTILAVVRPQDYNYGAIVGGDQNVFAFVSNGGYNDGPSLVAGNSYGPPAIVDTATVFETNTWYCVAVTYDAGTGVMKLYTNGNLVATATGVPAIDHPTGLYWGTLEGELWFTGDLGVCMTWERVVDADQIGQLSAAYLSRYVQPAATSSVVFDQAYTGGPPTTWTVPEGVSSISVVVVGAGGSGTADSYSAPGSDSIMIRVDNYVDISITNTGSSNTLVVDTGAYPNIANVTSDGTWIVSGPDIGQIANTIPKWDLVTAVDTTDPGNTVITLNNTVTTTAGDTFAFYQAVVAAEGGYEITDNNYSGPAPQPLVGSGGAGGLVDPNDSWPIGGGGAGGYTGSGGQGTAYGSLTATAGSGGAGGGGGGRQEDSGSGGGGTDIYGQGNNGAAGTFDSVVSDISIALGGSGGSQRFAVDGNGGQATAWNGGRGGWPGGGGASATGYWDGGLGGALAYRNNYAVTAGEEYIVLVGLGGQGQTDGGNGANGAVRIVWPGDTRQFPSTGVGADTVAVPTLDITGHYFGQPNGTVTFNISNTGGGTILEAGVIWGLPGQTTYSISVDVCTGSSTTAEKKAVRAADNCSNPYTTGLTGSQTIAFDANQFVYESINVLAYARNAAGVAYSPTVLSWTPTICLAEGTLVTLADGSTKAIENIAMSDSIRVWDFDTAVATSATPLWIKRQESTTQYNLIKFSDGSELKTVSQHRIFNKEAGAFTYPMTDATPIGTTTVRADGSEVTMVSKKVVYERVNYYNVVTAGGYMNLYANGILTSLRFNNIYPIADMRYTKDGRALRPATEFSAVGISDRWITGLRLPEQTTELDELKKYIARMERNEKTETPAATPPSWHK
jgi:hypothetical protein